MVAFKKLPWVAVDPLDWAGTLGRNSDFERKQRRLTVAVLDTTHLQHSLGSGSGDDTGTSGYSVSIIPLRYVTRRNIRAGISRHMTDPLFPETLHGTVCGSAMCEPQ